MNASFPCELGSGASPIPLSFSLPPFFPSSSFHLPGSPVWAQAKRAGLVSYSILSIYQTQITAQNAIPAQNVIRYSTTPFPSEAALYLFTSVCCMSASVYVYVTLTWHCWLPFSALPYSCIPLQIIKTHCVFFCFKYVVPWIQHIIINTPRPQVRVFTLQTAAVYGTSVFYFL